MRQYEKLYTTKQETKGFRELSGCSKNKPWRSENIMHKLKKIHATNITGMHPALEAYTDNDRTAVFSTSLLKDISELYLEVLVSMVSIDVIEIEDNQYQLICFNPLYDFLCRVERFNYYRINARIHMFVPKEKQIGIDDETQFIVIALLIKFAIEVPHFKNAGVQLFNRIELIKNDGKSSKYLNNIPNKLLTDLMKKNPSSIRGERQ